MNRKLALGLVAFCLAFTAAGALLLWPGSEEAGRGEAADAPAAQAAGAADAAAPVDPASPPEPGADAPAPEEVIDAIDALAPTAVPGTGPFAVEPATPPYAVQPRLRRPPAAGLLFDVASGEVLWARSPEVELPIASLTKMLTALIISERHAPRERVMISAKAPGVEGSRIGVLKPGRRVPLGGLFLGLILASGNDAAVALAEHDAGSVARFVKRMNARGAELGLGCSRFAGPAGLQDTGNSSCAYDLAALARADLADEWVASVISRRSAEVPFPVRGRTLSLGNNHYFVQRGIAGLPAARVTGVKTGLTNGAGRCYVTTARLGDRHLGVVLLDSPDPIRQVPLLLRAGFAAGR
jgi:D-alanyl-D-alanine carboxypeptidase